MAVPLHRGFVLRMESSIAVAKTGMGKDHKNEKESMPKGTFVSSESSDDDSSDDLVDSSFQHLMLQVCNPLPLYR